MTQFLLSYFTKQLFRDSIQFCNHHNETNSLVTLSPSCFLGILYLICFTRLMCKSIQLLFSTNILGLAKSVLKYVFIMHFDWSL